MAGGFLSIVGALSALALGEVPAFVCNDPAFSLARDGSHGILRAELATTQRGATYHFMQAAPVNGETLVIVTVGAPVGFGRGLPALSTLGISERINLPDGVAAVRVRVDNLRPAPFSVLCAAVPPPA